MNPKRTLIRNLPPSVKRALAVPYDYYQTHKADREFACKELPTNQAKSSAPDHIVWVVVDALRADHVSPELTPFLSELTGTDAVTPGTWTFPAVSSLLTGVYPHEHGAMRQTDKIDDTEGITIPPRLPDDRITLTEALAGAGYDTYGGFGHDTPFVALSGRFQKHELYHSLTANGADVLEDYLEWVDGRKKTCAFLHLADPHIPVDPPKNYWKKHDVDSSIEGVKDWRYKTNIECSDECERYRTHRRRLYRGAVEYVDDAIAAFYDRLQETVADPLFVVTADHGEAHWEHVKFDVEHFDGTGCVDHGGAPYEAVARVPLLTTADWNCDGLVSLVDLPATVADVTGVPVGKMAGRSLCKGVDPDRVVLTEGSLHGHEKKGVYHNKYKLLASRGHNVEIGYELPEETQTELPVDIQNALREQLPPWPDEDGQATEVSGVVEDRLEKLGYK